MNIFYKKNKLTPIINVSGFMTKIGASIVKKQNIYSANEVLPNFVNIDELQSLASKKISKYLRTESAVITASAAGGLTESIAAVITGKDLQKILKLPDIWNVHSGFDFERNFNETPFIKNGYITFGSFGNFRKISDEVIETWSNILKKIDNSKLVLKSSVNYENTILIDKFKKNGLEKRIKIYERSEFSNLKDHLNLYKNIDIALDTFPYNGVTTTFEALWMGVPVIGIKGYNFNSRCGESILKMQT